MGFDAVKAAEPLDYSFGRFAPGCSGTITEPSDTQIARFWVGLRQITAEARRHAAATRKALGAVGGAEDPGGAVEALDDAEAVTALHRRLAETYADLCSGRPSAEDILALPQRFRASFYEWIRTEVTSPSAVV